MFLVYERSERSLHVDHSVRRNHSRLRLVLDTSCESYPAKTFMEVGIWFIHTPWALTFPNLRRHLMCNICNIKGA